VVRCGFENAHQKDVCLNKIGLHAQNVLHNIINLHIIWIHYIFLKPLTPSLLNPFLDPNILHSKWLLKLPWHLSKTTPVVYPKSTPLSLPLSLKTSLLAYKSLSMDIFYNNFPPTNWKLTWGSLWGWVCIRWMYDMKPFLNAGPRWS
jgi:hypothetical protein